MLDWWMTQKRCCQLCKKINQDLLSYSVLAGAHLCMCQGQVKEGKLVNMPVYLIVSSRSVACNYIIMTETRHHRQTFNLLCHCLQVNCMFHLWSWEQINKTKCEKLASFHFRTLRLFKGYLIDNIAALYN